MTALKRRVIKCRLCPWATGVFSGRKAGWGRLANHVIHAHHLDIDAYAVATGHAKPSPEDDVR